MSLQKDHNMREFKQQFKPGALAQVHLDWVPEAEVTRDNDKLYAYAYDYLDERGQEDPHVSFNTQEIRLIIYDRELVLVVDSFKVEEDPSLNFVKILNSKGTVCFVDEIILE